MHRSALILLAYAAAAPAAAAPLRAPLAADAVPMIAHHAVYTLSLASSRQGAVTAASGTMSYDMTDVCRGWATSQRLQMDVTNRDGQLVKMTSDYATFESKDGRQLDFHMRQVTDTAVTSKVEGSAVLDGPDGSGSVHYTSPENKTLKLPPGTRLPTTHTETIIAGATQGKRFLTLPLFDGTGADGAQNTFVVIENWNDPSHQPQPALSSQPFGRVHISFFGLAPTEQTPNYQIAMRYYLNGVANDLTMDFDEFVMNGTLHEFKPVAQPTQC